MRLKLPLVLAFAAMVSASTVFAGGCSSTPATEDGGTGARICTPGSYVFCRCASGKEATKLCNEDGATFGACQEGENRPCTEQPDPNTGDSAVPQPVDSSVPSSPAAESCDGQNIALNPSVEVSISADTTNAKDDAKGEGACAGGASAPDHVYAFTAPATGKLTGTIVPEAKFAPIAYIRTACADGATQAVCVAGLAPGQTASVSANVIKGKTYYLIVDGAGGGNQSGKYTLKFKLDPGFFCGDGDVNDGETCDDINKVEGDGCSNDCRSNFNGDPDSAKSCPGQPVHVWGTTAVTGTGTTMNFPSTWDEPGGSCITGSKNNIAGDHIYAVTVHRAGTMTAAVTGASHNVLLSARTDCANAATMAANMCANNVSAAPQNESISFPVVSGRTYYVGVSGVLNATGPYSISFRIP